MRIAAILAQHVAEMPGCSEIGVGNGLAQSSGEQWTTLGSQHLDGALENLPCFAHTAGLRSENTFELCDGAVSTGGANSCGIGDLPTSGHCRDHNQRIENGERRRDHFAGHLTHQRAATRKVRDAFGEGDSVHVAGARLKSESRVVGVTFGREINLPDHRFESPAQRAGFCGKFGRIHESTVERRVPRLVIVSVEIEVCKEVDDEVVAAFAMLIPQLSKSNPPPTRTELEALVGSEASTLFLAKLEGRIVGSLTLAMFRIPTGVRAWIEDVVVDDSARGHGAGEALNQAALELARSHGAVTVDLTSRPSREAANRLYQRMGFVLRESNLYRYELKK